MVLLNPGPPLAPELMEQFGAAMSAGGRPPTTMPVGPSRSPPDFRNREPAALERHQLNTFIPFFKDRAAVDRVSLGFTEITAANVQQAPGAHDGRAWASLDPIRRFATIECADPRGPLGAGPDPARMEPVPGRPIPNADFALIEGGSHFPMVEDAEQLRSAVVPWLERVAVVN